MHPATGSPSGKRGPNRQLLTTLRIPTHITIARGEDSPRRISTVIWRTCLIIAALVLLNVALAGGIILAVKGFGRSGNGNVLMQLPAVQNLRQPIQSFLAQRRQQDRIGQEGGGSQQGQIASQLWERSLGRLLNRSDRFWASTIEAQPSDEPLPVSRPIRPDEELDQEPFVTVASQDDSSRSDRSELLEQTYEESQPDGRSHDSSTQADAEDSIAAKEVRELEAEVSTEGQKELRPDPKVRTTPSDIQARKRLGDLIPKLDPEAGNQNTGQVPEASSGLPKLQLDFDAAITEFQAQRLQDALPLATSEPVGKAIEVAAPMLAAELVTQAPMPSGPEAGSPTQAQLAGVRNRPVEPAAPVAAPIPGHQVSEPVEVTLPSNSLATDLQKGQFFPTKGQAVQVSITQDVQSTGDIIKDVHAEEEHSKAIASTAEVKNGRQLPAASPGPAQLEDLPDPCASALNIPKVAIMFISKAELFHESSWALWFQHAAGLLPVSVLRSDPDNEEAGCSSERLQLAQKYCSNPQSVAVLQRQHLFTVYLHPLPDFGNFPEESIFHGREIQDRIQVTWGAHELIVAERNLLGAALKDVLNRKFILLSESGLPLYPPHTTYLQLMHEDKSRLDSCGMGRTDPWRFGVRMGYKLRRHWRKSSQWFALTRKHAELVMQDTELMPIFQQHCQNAWDNDLNRWRDCFSDEHYMPSLIAYLQLGHETDCVGKLVNVDWSTAGAHPKSYSPFEVNPATIKRLRQGFYDGRPCAPDLAIGSSGAAFVRAGSISLEDAAQQACSRPGFNTTALTYDCGLFARKFPSYTASAAQHLLASCSSGLNITNDGICDQSAEEIPQQRVSSAHVNRRMLQGEEDAWLRHLISEQPGEGQWGTEGLQQHIPAWLEDRL